MDKKDIYEHLANIYLDASLKKKKKNKKNNKFKNLFFVSLGAVLAFGSFSLANIYKKNPMNSSQVALVLYPDAAKINFHFDPARKEIYSINLKRLNLASYRTLGFSVKKSNYKDTVSLRVEFTNSFNEKSYLYLKDIPHKWKEYKIPFLDFKNISDWSQMLSLSFVVEEWNTKDKKDIVYIDNIRILR